MTQTQRLAAVLFNLGGPSEEAAIRPFLFNFFMDRNIVDAPKPLRYLIATWISYTRSKGAARKSYALIGGKSPLLENTKKQAAALEKALEGYFPEARVFVSMRYWHPRAEETAAEVAAYNPDKIILLPLYPQFSTTTTLSALKNWDEEAKKARLHVETETICCYPEDRGFVKASTDLIRKAFETAPGKTRLLFSAHGLPEKIIRKGDPYKDQCNRTAEAIVKQLKIPGLDWQVCYQSRIGRLKWIGPSTLEALEKAGKDKTGVAVYPLAFVSEHVETLVELDMECRDHAKAAGVPHYIRVPTTGTHPEFIEGLKNIILSRLNRTDGTNGASCQYGVKYV